VSSGSTPQHGGSEGDFGRRACSEVPCCTDCTGTGLPGEFVPCDPALIARFGKSTGTRHTSLVPLVVVLLLLR
jgi:hypothetical protein